MIKNRSSLAVPLSKNCVSPSRFMKKAESLREGVGINLDNSKENQNYQTGGFVEKTRNKFPDADNADTVNSF